MEQKLKVVRILWLALVVAVLLFLVLLRFARAPSPIPEQMPALVGALSFGIAIMSVVLPARTFANALRNMKVNVIEAPGEVIGSFRESAPVVRVIAEPELAISDAFVRFQQPFLQGMALAESVALFGLYLGYGRCAPIVYLPFFALSLGLMISKFPTLDKIKRALEHAKNAKIMA